jgi:hypothetical protein
MAFLRVVREAQGGLGAGGCHAGHRDGGSRHENRIFRHIDSSSVPAVVGGAADLARK